MKARTEQIKINGSVFNPPRWATPRKTRRKRQRIEFFTKKYISVRAAKRAYDYYNWARDKKGKSALLKIKNILQWK